MPAAAAAALLGTLARLAGQPAPLSVVLEHAPLPPERRGHRALALPCAAVPAGTPPTFVYRTSDARALRRVPGASVVDPRDWTALASPRLVFVNPADVRGVGRGRHTVLLDAREAARLARRLRPGADLGRVYGVVAEERTTRVAIGYADMAPAALRRNLDAVFASHRALLGRAAVSRATLQAPGGVPLEVLGPTAATLAGGDAPQPVPAPGPARLVVRRR